MINLFKSQFPNFNILQESPILGSDTTVGWHVTALDLNRNPLGSGFARDLNQSRKIALAEFAERSFVSNKKNGENPASWCLDSHPTACGFAAGFDRKNTLIRSSFEALERWALSRWLDYECPLEEIKNEKHIFSDSPFSRELVKNFSDHKVFFKKFMIEVENETLDAVLSMFVGFVEGGAFVGSGVSTNAQLSAEHALIESTRHLLISKQDRNFNKFPFDRIKYFSTNESEVRNILSRERKSTWHSPKKFFQKECTEGSLFFSRTIFDDWIPWEKGKTNRFLY